MVIRKHRIRSLRSSLPFLAEGVEFVPAIRLDNIPIVKRRKIGFSNDPQPGERVLPSALGPISAYNADGKYMIHKDRPMEIAYRMAEWHWREYHGRDEVERTDFVDVPYRRYPRSFMQPPSVEFTIADAPNGQRYLIGPPLTLTDDSEGTGLHTVNLFLEVFGECEVLTSNLDMLYSAPLRRVNWSILPQGRYPWEKLKKHIDPIIHRAPKGNHPVIEYRLNSINSFGPEFIAVGRGGFWGYVVFGFPARNLYVLESVHTGNATYIFRNDWETLSQLTKAEILQDGLHEARLIHRRSWRTALNQIMRE